MTELAKTAGTSAAWRSLWQWAPTLLEQLLRGYTAIWETVNGETEKKRPKKNERQRHGKRWQQGYLRHKWKTFILQPQTLSIHPHFYTTPLVTESHRCLFLVWPFFTRIPRQNADTGINTNTPRGDSRWQSHKPLLPNLYSHMQLPADSCTRSSHRDLWEQQQTPFLTSRSVQLWLSLTVICYTGVMYF